MKRVHAQRKFAAGINIPNTRQTQQSGVDRRTETPPESRVFQIHTTPSSILDVVSFQGIHTHLQPIVVLKRLEDTASTSKANENGETQPSYQFRDRSKIKKSVRWEPCSDTGIYKKRKLNPNVYKKKSSYNIGALVKELSVPITPLPSTSKDTAVEEVSVHMSPLPSTSKDTGVKEVSVYMSPLPSTSKDTGVRELFVPVLSPPGTSKDTAVIIENSDSIIEEEEEEVVEGHIMQDTIEYADEILVKTKFENADYKEDTIEYADKIVVKAKFENADYKEGDAENSDDSDDCIIDDDLDYKLHYKPDETESSEESVIVIDIDDHAIGALNVPDFFRSTGDEIVMEQDIIPYPTESQVEDAVDFVYSEEANFTPECAQIEDTPSATANNPGITRTGKNKRNIMSCPSRHITSIKEIVCCSNTDLNEKCNDCNFCTKIKIVSSAVKALESSGLNLLLAENIIIENLRTDLIYEFGENLITDSELKEIIGAVRAKQLHINSQQNSPQSITHTSRASSSVSSGQNNHQTRSTINANVQSSTSNSSTPRNVRKPSKNSKVEISFAKAQDKSQKTEVTRKQVTSSEKRQRHETCNQNAGPSRGNSLGHRRRSTYKSASKLPGPSSGLSYDSSSSSVCSVSSSDDEVLSKKRKLNENQNVDRPEMLEAPVFRPTEDEFKDPMQYLESILPSAAKYGLCKVIPPDTFDPPCILDNDIRFGITYQYIARMYKRWGPAARELCNIRANLITQKVQCNRPPLLEGLEVNLPKLFNVVQRLGGMKNVFTKKKWNKVAEEMRYKKLINPEKRLDQIYVKFLLAYDTLTYHERKRLVNQVNRLWKKRNENMLRRAMNPLHRQKRMLAESDSSSDEEYAPEDVPIYEALSETEDCVIAGRNMTLKMFKKIANTAVNINIDTHTCSPENVERIYWKHVETGEDHVCVYAASIDTGVANLGFPNDEQAYRNHPWNLKRLSENPRNVLSYLGPVVGMTVPTLHLAMVFSTSCWHRDPHGLPWIEYIHEGSEKIWYGIPDDQSDNFRSAVETLCPTFCQNKSIWLPSDITMIPPEVLQEYNVSMCRATQNPGEFIIVCPKAYSCSIATNLSVSESVYFATKSWMDNYAQVFQELRNSCEPAMFSIEQLLLSFTKDSRTPLDMLHQIYPVLNEIVKKELQNRRSIKRLGFKGKDIEAKPPTTGAWNVRDQDECELCRVTLYLSRVRGMFEKKSTLCLEHALAILKKNVRPKFLLEVEHIMPSESLTQIVETLQNRLSKT
ncbi:protein Jumonji isoform X3 [Zerene cesonia]|uniref:protein Jumonji isoform X3 n=1 Tax=Zerene cesonia TaxID=33412 RepID=UPI0018E4E35C|nr:protein Jumonji isoform X3 [Zerene cesonia]